MSLKLVGRLNLDIGIIGFVALLLLLLALFDGDVMIARYFFFDATTNEWIARHDWWANELLHTGGRNLMRLVGVLALVAWAASYRSMRLSAYRADLGYFAACMVLVPLTIGILKQVTNVDCPWDLQEFGGSMPMIHWFESRPADLPHAACFPGAHSSSAFALFGLFFCLALNTAYMGDRRITLHLGTGHGIFDRSTIPRRSFFVARYRLGTTRLADLSRVASILGK